MHEFGIYIGRFQPFHNAHLETVRFALKQAKKLIIVIGSDNQARTTKNPWTSEERIAMMKSAISVDAHAVVMSQSKVYKDYIEPTGTKLPADVLDQIIFITAKDYLYNENLWIAAVQQAIGTVTQGSKDVVLIGHKKDETSFYLKLFPQWKFIETEFFDVHCDATKIRDMMFKQDKITIKDRVPFYVYNYVISFMDGPEFKRLKEEHDHIVQYKAEWEDAPFPPMFVTTDAVVICSGHILVVRRKGAPGRGLIALPGGFLQQEEKIVDGCIRELKEETGIKIPVTDLKSHIVGERVFDHPHRSLRGRTITHAFCIKLKDGNLPEVKGMDDADKAWWVPLRDVFSRENEFFEDHFHIINFFVTRF